MPGTVHVFPGQGDFAVSMLLRGAADSPPLRRTAESVFDEIDERAVGRGLRPLRRWLFGDRPPGGRELAHAAPGTLQLALFGASMSVHRALCARLGEPDAVLGVSFGEIAALTAAGVYTVADGAGIAHDLALVLATCPGGLTLLSGDERAAEQLIGRADTRDVVVACVNDDAETLVGGPLAQLERVEEEARRSGTAAVRLRLPFGSHHPSYTSQARRFARDVRRYPVAEARTAAYSAVAGRRYEKDDDLALRLADCLVRPVRLPDVLGRLGKLRTCDFYEAGTGSALARSVGRVLAAEGPGNGAAHGTIHGPAVRAPLADGDFDWASPADAGPPQTSGAPPQTSAGLPQTSAGLPQSSAGPPQSSAGLPGAPAR
ncbi:ACP S-malonyltransferase [Streptomyces sp. NPDC021093]|uniref:ACP S-malonyltransferase n=1 Tax=Streptomyces sp. NPDC021093 TaxID=3365112 RepID=UPI003795EE4F